MLESPYPPSLIKPKKEFDNSSSKVSSVSDSRPQSVFMSKPGWKFTPTFPKLKLGKSKSNVQRRPWSTTTDSTFRQTWDENVVKSKQSKRKISKIPYGCPSSATTSSISSKEGEKMKVANPWKINQLFNGRPFWPSVKDQDTPNSTTGTKHVKDFREVIYHSDGSHKNNIKDEASYFDYHAECTAKSRTPAHYSAIKEFRKLQLSDEQIIGLENLGFNFSKFVPRTNLECPADPRIPPSFKFSGAFCYWCETPQHVSFGVALLLKDNPAVVGIDLEWTKKINLSGYTSKVALIKIATEEIVLLVPTKTNTDDKDFSMHNSLNHSTPKALQILLRDPEIIKLGVDVEKNLLTLWTDFELEANSWTELNELIHHSRFDFGDKSSSKISLNTMAATLGYRSLKIEELNFSWDSRPLSWCQLHQAAEDALMTIRVFWGLMDGRLSKLMSSSEIRANIENLVDRFCKQLPISRLDKNQRIAKLKKDLFGSSDFDKNHNSKDRKAKTSRESSGGGSCSGDSLETPDEMRSPNLISSQKYLNTFFSGYRF